MSTEAEYRHLKCPGNDCPKKLRISITSENYGKTVIATCPSCGAKARVKIPLPAEKRQNTFELLQEIFGENIFDKK